MQPGTAPIPIMIRQILSTAIRQTPSQAACELVALRALRRDSLKPAMAMRATIPAPNWPRPCMAKTAPIMAPLHLVVANSEVMMEDSG